MPTCADDPELFTRCNKYITLVCPKCGDKSIIWLAMFYNGDTYCRKCNMTKKPDEAGKKILEETGIII